MSEHLKAAEAPAPQKLLTADEVAEALKVSTASVRLWQRQGVPHVPIGRLKRYVLHEVIEWHRRRAEQQQREALRNLA